MTVNTKDANAVVCAAGVDRAGCAGPRGAAVVVRPPVAACHYVVVNGVRFLTQIQGRPQRRDTLAQLEAN
jgi:hypothetical protein